MNCPSCNSENTQRLEVIFEHGTDHITTTSKTSVRPFMRLLPSAKAKTRTTGIAMSKAAQKAAPPFKKGYKTPVIGLLIGLGAILYQFGGDFNTLWFILGLAAAGGFGWLLFTAIRYNVQRWPSDHSAWQKRWMCNKCGVVFAEE